MTTPRTEAGNIIVDALHGYHRIQERGNWIVAQDHAIGGNPGNCVGCDAEALVNAIEAEAIERYKAALRAEVERLMARALTVAEQKDEEADKAFGLGRMAGLLEGRDAIERVKA